MGSPAKPQVKSLHCPNCGGPVAIRGFAHTLTVACEHCGSVLDAKDPGLKILQKASSQPFKPLIPLGTRGKFGNDTWEVIGFQVRSIVGGPYTWDEYLLFNPYKGFRYLTFYTGHWNFVTVLRTLPDVRATARPSAELNGKRYRHFVTGEVETSYVIGEFPWQIRLGERVTFMDFISPPHLLSSEGTASETTWALGEYTPGSEIWKAFKLPESPPPRFGVFENQPSPYKGGIARLWLLFAVFLALLIVLAIGTYSMAREEKVLDRSYTFTPTAAATPVTPSPGTEPGTGTSGTEPGTTTPETTTPPAAAPAKTPEPSFVTDPFDLKGRQSDVEVTIKTDLSNNWAYFSLALINAENGQVYDFGREVSYYYGTDSDGSWSEGARDREVLIPSVPSGQYYLRVEPEMDANAAPVHYEIVIRRDVPAASFFWFAVLLLIIPPIIWSIRSGKFEQSRWSESDYGSG